ncbi:hypothetical protein [Paenibacillus tengchongensis]|uniref:hypothetical protein n=1 Tax=Paenibacillus tengchongensis TaxID=2608684 RepID=UPI00124F399F|nr:hypothetical protein [Paenibacillus tengchongensis]
MLADTPRKLLRIMVHFHGHYRRMPILEELVRLSGRTRAGVLSGLRVLAQEGYIRWQHTQPPEAAEIAVAWEEDTAGHSPRSRVRGIPYWLD